MEIILTIKLKTSAQNVYTTWLSSEGHTNMTGGNATASDKVGDHFTSWDEYISGENIELIPYSKIVQSWRTTQYEEDEPDSQIEIQLKEMDNETELTLIHTNVPESGEHYRKGWDEHYFKPMIEYFSK